MVCARNSRLVTMFVFGVISIEVWHTQLPVWGFVLALVIGKIVSYYDRQFTIYLHKYTAFVYTIPIGMIQAITNQQVGLKLVDPCLILDQLLTLFPASSRS